MKGEFHWNWKGGKKYYYKKKEKFNINENYKRYEYELKSPDGLIIRTKSMRKTCEEYGLDHRTMNKIANGKRNVHKGWVVKVINIL